MKYLALFTLLLSINSFASDLENAKEVEPSLYNCSAERYLGRGEKKDCGTAKVYEGDWTQIGEEMHYFKSCNLIIGATKSLENLYFFKARSFKNDREYNALRMNLKELAPIDASLTSIKIGRFSKEHTPQNEVRIKCNPITKD
jgi:hypothetical protein